MDFWKFSNLDAYSNNEKNGRKLTYQRLVEIRESNIDELNKTLSENEYTYSSFKKWYWVFFSVMLILIFVTGGLLKGYFMDEQNYRQIDMSSVWENQEGDALYRLLKKN